MAETQDAMIRSSGAKALVGTRIPALPEEITAFCQRWSVDELALFGSVLREDFGPHSDIDVLIKFASPRTPGMFGIVRMERELAELFGRQVDLVTRPAVENSRNPIRRQAILEDARIIYAA